MRAFPGAVIYSDHSSIFTNLRLNDARPTNLQVHFDLDKLQGLNVAELNMTDCDVDTLSGHIKEVLQFRARKVLGCLKVKKQPWVIKAWNENRVMGRKQTF